MARIFLSFAHPNAVAARQAVEALTADGFEVWWDDQLPTHRTFYEVIDERLREAEAVVALWSAEAAKSDWVRAEADFGRTHGKLVQASLDDGLPPMPFNQIQCAKLADWKGDVRHPEWLKLLHGVREVVGQKSPAVDPVPVFRRRRWRPVLWLSSFVAIAAAVVGLFLLTPSQESPGLASRSPDAGLLATGEVRLAVLPFEAIGTSGVANELAAALADKLSGSLSEHFLQTIGVARSGELPADDRRSKLAALGVGFVLGGSVRATSGGFSVRVYVEDLASEFTVWSAQFERGSDEQGLLLNEVTVITTTVAYDIAEVLMQPDAGVDAQALSLSLKAGEAMRNAAPIQRTIVMLERLIDLAPKFADAHGRLALVLARAGSARSRQEALTSISLYPPAGAAYDALYFLARHEAPEDLELADRRLGEGLAAAPSSPFLYMRRCEFLLDVGRIREAVDSCAQAVALHPLAPPPTFRLVRALGFSGAEHAWAELERAAANHPNSHWVNTLRVELLLNAGRTMEVAALFAEPSTRPAWVSLAALPIYQACLRALDSGARADVDLAMEQLLAAASAGTVDPVVAARFAARLGRVDDALALLERVDVRVFVDTFTFASIFDPALRSVHRDPRFMALVAPTGLITYWRTTGVWPDFCADPTLPYSCEAEAANALPVL